MATRAQIQRLCERVEALANCHAASQRDIRCPTIIVELGETEEAAWERHLGQHPEDRDPPRAIVIQIVDHQTASNGTGVPRGHGERA